MKTNFTKSLAAVLQHEGGWSDHTEDPGGATNKGITLAVFRRYYGDAMSKDDLKAIPDEKVEHIYKKGYWDPCRCDDLPSGIDYVVFDQAVNSGPSRSGKWLQSVVGVEADGVIGPKTLAAVGNKPAAEIINEMCDLRLQFLKSLSTWPTFGRGWGLRVTGVAVLGLQLAGSVLPAVTRADAWLRTKARHLPFSDVSVVLLDDALEAIARARKENAE